MANKPGRNAPCPCGSGKKYKKCHGSIAVPRIDPNIIRTLFAREMAKAKQREDQQGLGRPILSAEVGGQRVVVVKNRLVNSRNWKTFPDFLNDYIKTAMGSDGWGNEEIKKPLAERHPILQWYDKLCTLQNAHRQPGAVIQGMPATGAVSAYYGLAYDLYCLDHNAELQEKLIKRLKNRGNFYGARNEVSVAAKLIRAGFSIEFEDEDDRGSTHCEYTATHQKTGRKFSVECKMRDAQPDGSLLISGLGKTLRSALLKKADHERVVFIDLNFKFGTVRDAIFKKMDWAMKHVKKFETNPQNSKGLPPAYIFLTNHPLHLSLDDTEVAFAAVSDGFKLPDYCPSRPRPLREVIESRERHREIVDLMKSIERHSKVPTTFDGEISEFAFGEAESRLLVGNRYLAKDENNNDVPATLVSATVLEGEQAAHCLLQLDTGGTIIAKWPLTDAEMRAYRSHPDTFFGEISGNRKADDPLELYDFFFETYSKSTKEKLLEFMAGYPDIERLRAMSQRDLASLYCENCVHAVMAQKDGAAS